MVKIAMVPKTTDEFIAIMIKNSSGILHENRKSILKFILIHKRHRIPKAILCKRSNTGGINNT
jgi:hypothetical protein